MVMIDCDKVPDAEFSNLPPGRYQTIIKSAMEKDWRNTCNKVEVKLSVVNGLHEGSGITTWFYLSEKGFPMFKTFCKILGYDMKGQVDIDLNTMTGKAIGIIVKEEEYQGDLKSKVSSFMDVDKVEKEEVATEGEPSKEEVPF